MNVVRLIPHRIREALAFDRRADTDGALAIKRRVEQASLLRAALDDWQRAVHMWNETGTESHLLAMLAAEKRVDEAYAAANGREPRPRAQRDSEGR